MLLVSRSAAAIYLDGSFETEKYVVIKGWNWK